VFCPTLIDPACIVGSVTGPAASAVAGGAVDQIAATIQSGVAWVVASTVDWWVKVASPDLAAEPAVGRLQQWILPAAAAVAALGMIIAAGKMVLTRKASPLTDVGSGLAVLAATSAVGVLLPSLLLKAGDAWSAWALNTATGGKFAQRLNALLSLTGAPHGVVIVLGIVAIIIAAVQAVLMLLRQAALVILAGVLPLAAAGTLTPATRSWFRRVTGWMLALIFYKPAAAAVYATAFTMIGSGGSSSTRLTGFAMVLMSLLALPVLMKFFTWTSGAAESSTGGSGFLTTAIGGAVAIGALRGLSGGTGGSPAVEQARLVSSQLGTQGSGGERSGPHGAAAAGFSSRPGTARFPGAAASGASKAAGAGAARGGATPYAASPPGAGTPAGDATGAGGPASGGAATNPLGTAATGPASGTGTARGAADGTTQPPHTET